MNSNNYEQIASELFIKNIKDSKIKTINLVSDGFTNASFKVIDKKNNAYLIKVSKTKQEMMINESKLYSLYDNSILLYSDKNCNLIKKWIDGENFNLNKDKKERIKLLANEIKKIQSLEISIKDFPLFDFSKFAEWQAKKNKYLELYNFVLKRFNNAKLVLSHGDVNNKNVIITKKSKATKVKLIDFEWCCINYEWFDLINYLCEEEIYDIDTLTLFIKHIKGVKDVNDIYQLMFVRWYYCLAWAIHEINHLDNMKSYIKKAKRNTKFLFKKIIKEKIYIPLKSFNWF